MPPKAQTSSSPATRNLSAKRVRQIWGDLKPQSFFDRLRALDQGTRWQLAGHRISGCCPFHNDSTPSFNIYLDRGYAKCFGCEVFIWNPIELWSKLRKIGYSDALTELRTHFGLKFLPNSVQNQLTAWQKNQHVKRRIMEVCHLELVNALHNPDDPNYADAQDAVNWLTGSRKLPRETLSELHHVGVLPPTGRILNALTEDYFVATQFEEQAAAKEERKIREVYDYTADAEKYLEDVQAWRGAVIFQLDVAPDTIGRLKLRRPHKPTSESRFIDDAFEEDLGFFGLGWAHYQTMLGSQAKYVTGVYVVEGEFDALSIHARQVQKSAPGYIVVAVGGKSQDGTVIDNLRHFGFDRVYLFADRPGDKRGEELVQHWLPGVKNLRAFVFAGYDRFPGHCGDPDAVACEVGLEGLSKLLLDTENRSLFQTPPDWVFEQVQPEVMKIDEGDPRARIEVASNMGRLLRNNIDCDLYVDACARAFGMNPASLKREVVAREEDEPGFILRLVDELRRQFFPYAQGNDGGVRSIYLWHIARREVVLVNLADDSSIERELGPKLGPSYQFFEEKVGMPSFLQVPDVVKEQGKYLQKLDKDLRFYLRQALTIMSQSTPDFGTALHMGQGLHAAPTQDGSAPTLYLVNGRDVYRGIFDPTDALTWTKIEGPSHDGIIFDVGVNHVESAWLSVRNVDDLNRANNVDLQSCWDRLHRVLDIGWTFKNHAITVEFMTAHLLATTINSAFKRQVVVHFCAETSAGKSKLGLGLIGGVEKMSLQVIEAAIGLQTWSPAGFRQTMHNCARPVCLDEFESDGADNNSKKKSEQVMETLENIRGLTGETNQVVQGSRGGDRRVFNLRFFAFLSAIAPLRKVQDANRVVRIDLDKREGRAAPEDLIPQELGDDFIPNLKKDLSTGFFPQIAKIQRLYCEIEKEFAVPGAKPVRIEQRYFQALYPAMSVMKLLGRDYRSWVMDFCEATKPALTSDAGENTDSAQLFQWVLSSASIPMHGEHGGYKTSLLHLLANKETRTKVNETSAGVYFDEASQLLIINWTAAVQSVLANHSRYGRETNMANIREIAGRSKYAVKLDTLVASGAIARLKGVGVTHIPLSQITAYSVKHIVDGDATADETVPAVVAPEPKRQSDDGEFGLA